MGLDRRGVLAGMGAMLMGGPAMAGSAMAGPAMAGTQQAFSTGGVRRGRAIVPVRINGVERTLSFAVDTAANCSVVAEDLMTPLNLSPAAPLGMHTLAGREITPSIRCDRLVSGALDRTDVRMALGRRSAMAGLDGLLGSDLLVDRRLVLNFRGGERARISRSRSPARGFLDAPDPRTTLVTAADRRFDSLLMIRARVGTTPATAIIDSGAECSILNRAAAVAGRAQPQAQRDGSRRMRIQTPTGEGVTADVMLLPSLGFAGISVGQLPVAVGDFHTFDLWGLSDRPAMLLGLDVLRMFDSVFIDLKRGEFAVRT